MNTSTLISNIEPEKHSGIYWMFSDSWIMTKRSVKHIITNIDQLMSAAIMPIMFLLLFRYVFGGAINTGETTYVNYLIAGIVVQIATFGASTTAVNVAVDLQRGIVDRFRSMPVFSSGLLIGHVVADLVRNSISTVIVIGFSFLIGFRPDASPIEWLLVIGILLLFTFAASWICAIAGILAKSIEAANWMTFMFIFPMTFASSAFVPTDTMPVVLRVFAENQPFTIVINAMRAWLVGTPIGNDGWLALFWCLGIIAVAVPISTWLFHHKSTR